MKSPGQIYMDYKKALQKADELDNIAGNLRRLADRDLQGTMQNISLGWKSDNASRYLAKGEELGNNIKGTSRKISQIAAAVRAVARRVYEAEMKAYRIAMTRKYQ